MKAGKFLCLFILILCSDGLYASHAAGGYFEYTCIGNNQYQVDYYFLRDCGGAPAPSYLTFYLTNGCTTTACWPDNGIDAEKVNTENVEYGCGNNCNGGSSNATSLQLIKYTTAITLPYECADWKVQVSIVERNEVDYCQTLGNEFYYNYCIINNLNGNCSSSVEIEGYPYAVGCSGSSGTALYNVVNSSGNTLEYAFVYPQEGDCQNHWNMEFVGNTSVNKPFPASSNFELLDGTFTFSPSNYEGTSYFAVRIREYDLSNTLIGETVIDGIVEVANDCLPGNSITFSDWFDDNDNEFHVEAAEEFCAELHLTPNDNDEDVTGVTLNGLPTYLTYTVEYNQDGTSNVVVCGQFPPEVLCQQLVINFTVVANTNTGSCFSTVTGSGFIGDYKIVKEKGDYCPENLFFTNRNAQSGIPMPLYAHAEERIWVGDSMPAIAPIQIQNGEGIVEVNGNLTLEAGLEIIIPSCKTGPCVTITGNQTLIINPNSCSADCEQTLLNVQVHNLFECDHEKLWAEVEGDGPYNYKWIIKGDTIVTDLYYLLVHDYASNDSSGLIPYSCEVFDANGNSGVFNGEILGTNSFYKHISNHVEFFDYDPGDLWEDGYYYAGQPGVAYNRPFFVADSINPIAPWYGATWMECIVWDRWGTSILYNFNRTLEGGEDWSFDNGEIWWDGKFPGTNYCAGGSADILMYELRAKNCASAAIHEEISALIILACYDGSWYPAEAKSMLDAKDAYYQDLTGVTRYLDIDTLIARSDNNEVMCFPNPAETNLFVKSSTLPLQAIIIIDASGKAVLQEVSDEPEVQLDITGLRSGIYTIIVKTTDGQENRLKLVKR